MKILLVPAFLALSIVTSGQNPVSPFPLSSVKLLNSPFEQAEKTDLKYILEMDADRLLAPFLKEAGIAPKKENYGNWENAGLDGHIGGHYLSALANMYAATGDKEILRRLNYMIDWLDSCQRKNGNGYISGVPGGKAMWEDISKGKINANAFGLNNKWVPLYNIHKLFAGLRDAFLIAGNKKAKSVLIGLANWFDQIIANLSNEQIQQMLRSEHGGMNEVFADVAAITGNKKYLETGRRLSHWAILSPLLEGKDSLTGVHANTQIPKVIGFKRIAELNGDTSWARAADFFWNTVVQHRSVSIGGNSVREHFHPATDFSSMINDIQGPETCNTYNMLRLTEKLFFTNPNSSYLDYYERAMYNHILSSEHPDGGFVYFTPMRPQHYRVYSQPQESFWCCVGSGIENHAKYGELIYAHDTKDLYVNFFIPSRLTWKEKGLLLSQQTQFPNEESSTIKLTLNKPSAFGIHIRYPSWINKGEMKVLVNGQQWKAVSDKNGFVVVNRNWRSGDVISLRLPMHTAIEHLPDGSPWISFIHGPIVLAAKTDTSNLAGLRADGSRMGHVANGKLYPIDAAPFIVSSAQNPGLQLKPVPGKPLWFTAASIVYPSTFQNLVLQPFYQVHDARYMLYWRMTSKEDLDKIRERLRANEAQKLALAEKTLDEIAPGEQQPEVEHDFKSDRSESGTINDWHYRNTTRWFSYQLRNTNGAGKKLLVSYYGEERNTAFDVLINNVVIKSEVFDGSRKNMPFDVEYILPDSIIQSNSPLLEVKFTAKDGSRSARVVYVRLVK